MRPDNVPYRGELRRKLGQDAAAEANLREAISLTQEMSARVGPDIPRHDGLYGMGRLRKRGISARLIYLTERGDEGRTRQSDPVVALELFPRDRCLYRLRGLVSDVQPRARRGVAPFAVASVCGHVLSGVYPCIPLEHVNGILDPVEGREAVNK